MKHKNLTTVGFGLTLIVFLLKPRITLKFTKPSALPLKDKDATESKTKVASMGMHFEPSKSNVLFLNELQ